MPEITMPKLSDTMTEGTLVSWKKKKGDQVAAGDVLAEIETDKATMEWESPEDGVLTEIYVEEGGKVDVGTKIAFIGEKGETASAKAAPSKEKKPAKAEQEAKAETEKPAPAAKEEKETAPPRQAAKKADVGAPSPPKQPKEHLAPASDEARIKASPVARRLASELGVDLAKIQGTGPEGRIIESDVRSAAKSEKAPAGATAKTSAGKSAAPSGRPAQGARIQLSGMRAVIAQRLVESKGPVPHFYLTIVVDAGPLVAARAE